MLQIKSDLTVSPALNQIDEVHFDSVHTIFTQRSTGLAWGGGGGRWWWGES